jgi:hypothetical protein
VKETSAAVRSLWGVLYACAGIAFFFSIIGVFGLSGAVLSLVLYVTLSIVLILQKNRAES